MLLDIASYFRRAFSFVGIEIRPDADTAGVGISAGSAAPSAAVSAGSLYIRSDGSLWQRIANAWYGFSIRYAVQRAYVEITPAQLRALRATPITLVAAPGAGKFVELVAMHAWLDYGTTAHNAPTNANDDISARYTDGNGTQVATLEATGFVNATADQHRIVNATSGAPNSPAQYTPVENAALVAHNSGGAEYGGTGDSPLKIEVFYRVRTLEPTA